MFERDYRHSSLAITIYLHCAQALLPVRYLIKSFGLLSYVPLLSAAAEKAVTLINNSHFALARLKTRRRAYPQGLRALLLDSSESAAGLVHKC